MRPEIAIHADDVGVIEAGKRLRLFDEAVETPLVVGRAVARAGGCVLFAIAGRKVRREVFLDGDLARECDLVGEVCDTESAGTKHALDLVIANEFCSAGKREQVCHRPSDTSVSLLVRCGRKNLLET
jgi:hypothetical protein